MTFPLVYMQEERKHYLEWRGTLFRRALENDAKEIEYEAIMKKDAQEKWKEQVCGRS